MRWEIISRQKKATDLIEFLLRNRGITPAKRADFLAPDFARLGDPNLFLGMAKAVRRTISALRQGERIGIFVDYDADGIPAGVLLYHGLKFLRQCLKLPFDPPPVYIPRRNEGYGLSREGIDQLKKAGVTLVIAADLGITARVEVEYAKTQKVDTIIIDHHLIQPEKLPRQSIIIDPKQSRDRYPFKDHSAGGLVWNFLKSCALEIDANPRQIEHFLKWSLDLVAISTIADIVPLVGENRILAKFGLVVLQKTQRLGLAELYKTAKIERAQVSPYTVGFQIGPRLNAPGRLDQGWPAFELLTTDDPKKARQLAERLETINRERQAELERILEEAIAEVEKKQLHQHKLILVAQRGWQNGLIGLVAGKLVERYHRPAIVLNKAGKFARGSARSTEALHILEILAETEKLLIRFGGHARAAGLTLKTELLPEFYDRLIALANQKLTAADIEPRIKLDAWLGLERCNLATVRQLQKLEPHGFGNPRPTFAISGAKISRASAVGQNNQHLKLTLNSLADESKSYEAIGFGLGERLKDLKPGQAVELAGSLQAETWQGTTKCTINFQDIRLTE